MSPSARHKTPSSRHDRECLVFSQQAFHKERAARWQQNVAIPAPFRGCPHWSSQCSVTVLGRRLREFWLSRTNRCPCNTSPLHVQTNNCCSWHVSKQTDLPARRLQFLRAYQAPRSCHPGECRQPRRPVFL